MEAPAWLQGPVLIGAISLLIVLLAGIWWWVPRWSANRLRLKVRDAKARADIEDNFRKTLSQLFGGVAVLLGAAFAYHQSQTTLQQARDLLISQQTSKGFEQLGNGEMIIRLGGIYALEGVMNASLVYHVPIVEALAAFIRERAPRREPANPEPPPQTDVQAALTVLGRRVLRETETSGVDLAQTHLQHAHLFGAHLTGAFLIDANLTAAFLFRANLTRANLTGANLSNVVCDAQTKLPRGVQLPWCTSGVSTAPR